MLLKGPSIQLIPYAPIFWSYMARWFYDADYRDMWRHHPKAWGQAEFEKYPQIICGDVFIIIKDEKPVGFIQMIPDCKTNRGFYVGILLDKSCRELHFTHEAFVLLFNYAFNRLGYRKAIVEILASKDGLKKGLLKAGFLSEGTQFGEAYINGVFVDECRLSMSADYFNKHYKGVAELWDHSTNC